MIKTEEDVCFEIMEYIKGSKHNRPCTLSSIKKELRTPKIVDLIFSHPNIFHLNVEFNYVPFKPERLLIRFILGNPNRLALLSEYEQTVPLLIAFEFSKQRFEHISRINWGQWGGAEKVEYLGKSKNYSDALIYHHSNILAMCNDKSTTEDLIDIILEYCNSNKIILETNKTYERKYYEVDFNIGKRLFILISGLPDSGKTTIARLLLSSIKDAKNIDSDVLFEKDLICSPLSSLIASTDKVIIFSDIYANQFFEDKEIGDANIINVLVKPLSIEIMHQHSKYMGHIPFEEYKKHEIDKYNFDRIVEPIIVNNNYTRGIYKERDRVIEEIANRLGIDLSPYLITNINNNAVEENAPAKVKK